MKEKHMRLIGNFLFPVVLVGVIIMSAWMQTPIISSPEVAKDFQDRGSEEGYFEDPAPALSQWPANLPAPLLQALKKSFGPQMPESKAFYWFGLSRRPWLAGTSLKYGAETVLTASGDRSSSKRLALFGFQVSLLMNGRNNGLAWRLIGGSPAPAEEKTARAAVWLEKAALLLPLAKAGLNWTEIRPGVISAKVEQDAVLELAFSNNRLASAKMDGFELRPSQFRAFGKYDLPARWTGNWGQAGQTRFDVSGLIFNPPFAAQAVKPPKKEK